MDLANMDLKQQLTASIDELYTTLADLVKTVVISRNRKDSYDVESGVVDKVDISYECAAIFMSDKSGAESGIYNFINSSGTGSASSGITNHDQNERQYYIRSSDMEHPVSVGMSLTDDTSFKVVETKYDPLNVGCTLKVVSVL